MFLYLVRHGQSSNNALGDSRANRVCDPPLTELGERQAELVGRHLARGIDRDPAKPYDLECGGPKSPQGHGITAIYASPMRRALQTAQAISRQTGIAPRVSLDIHEHGGIYLDHGEPRGIVGYPGLKRSEVLSGFPGFELPDGLSEDGWWHGALESRQDAHARAVRFLSLMRRRAAETGRIAVVTHAGFTNLFLNAVLGFPAETRDFFHISNTGVTLIRFRADGDVNLRYVNRVEFLPPEMIV